MFCIVAFIVLSILGIFSASNRELAGEAISCVFDRVTFRPCTTGFDVKMKSRILGRVITRSETAARLINSNFELLSWTFFVLMLASSIWFVRGVYLFYTTGSCNGLNSTAFCVFDPTGKNNQVSNATTGSGCSAQPVNEANLSLKGVDLTTFSVLNKGVQNSIVMIGCYHCDYTRATYPLIRELTKKFNVSFTFFNYPLPGKEDTDYFSRLGYCANQQDPATFWKLNDTLFTGAKTNLDDQSYISKTLASLGLDSDLMKWCMTDPQTQLAVRKQMSEVEKTHFPGTPTIFINGKGFVGPKPYRVYAISLKGLFYWLF